MLKHYCSCLSSDLFCVWPAVFSAVTLLLLPHSQGNVWLYEDSVLITGKLPGKCTRRSLSVHLTCTLLVNAFYLKYIVVRSRFSLLMCHIVLTDSSSQPKVKFPKNLLAIPDKSNISSVTAYLTVPHHHLAKDCVNCTPGIIISKSGEC